MNIAEHIAQILLKEKAVFLRPEEPFTWTSGIKSPVYCDNRLLISSVESREAIIEAFIETIQSLKVEIIAGTATAGIPWAAWIADRMKLPLVYIRSSSKEHGRQNAIEGRTIPGQTVVLVEDLISTGKSSVAAAQKLLEAQVKVKSIMSIFSYEFQDAQEVFHRHHLQHQSLCNFEILAKVAYDHRMLDEKALTQVLEWRKSVHFL
jgi:orotate phosphoribosyltransferase